jgi:hypothetical protein
MAEQRGWRIWRSITGAVFAALYSLAFAWAYIDYLNSPRGWFSDLVLILMVSPFVVVMRFLTGGGHDFGGSDTGYVIVGGIFCTALVWVIGAGIEALVRRIVRMAKGDAPA